MRKARRRLALAACAALLCTACRPDPGPGEPLQISLQPSAGNAESTRVEVAGLSRSEISDLRGAALDRSAWTALFAVTLDWASSPALPPVEGQYDITADRVRFTPRFPFVPGRSYRVVFDPAKMPRPREAPAVVATLGLPAVHVSATTTVAAVYPSADVVPENLLRMYVEFSAPMGSSAAGEFVRLIDRTGPKEEVVEGAFLPVEADFWSPDHRRYTLFLDPGRVKQDILPNRQSGRPLKAGRRYAIEIDASWTDANRQPLAATFRHEFRAGPLVESAIMLRDWTLTPPAAGTTAPLAVSFPRPLDHAVVIRALSVETSDGRRVSGTSRTEEADTRWIFTPDRPWDPSEHRLVALSFLEDPQGNQINRPFEEAVDAPTPAQAPESFHIPFTTRPATEPR